MSSCHQPREDPSSSSISEEQRKILEYNFCNLSRQPDGATLMLIAAEAGLSVADTQLWFKKRLAKWRESEGLPAECGSVTD